MQHITGQHPNWLENQEGNLFFQDGAVSAVIDWDRAEVRSPAEEIVRSMHLSFDLDPRLCHSFLDRYRTRVAISDDVLDTAAANYSAHRACDLWLYQTIYVDGDDRPRRFVTPGRFAPFANQWEHLQAALREST